MERFRVGIPELRVLAVERFIFGMIKRPALDKCE